MKDKTIGMVGIGLMGLGIATNIRQKGWALNFLAHEGNQPTGELEKSGAKSFKSAAELAQNSDVIIICVTGSPQVEAVITAKGGILEGLRPGTIVIDCSTAIPEKTIMLAKKVAEAGGQFLDSPMTRTPKEAREGRLNLIIGGDRQVYENCLPVLESFAENITYAGGTGAGHAMKLLHNFVSLGFSTLLAEAVAASEKAGVDVNILHDVLAKGGGGGVILERMAPYMLKKDNAAFVFSLANTHKDIGYYLDMCADLGASVEVATGVKSVLQKQIDEGRGEHYIPELIDLV